VELISLGDRGVRGDRGWYLDGVMNIVTVFTFLLMRQA